MQTRSTICVFMCLLLTPSYVRSTNISAWKTLIRHLGKVRTQGRGNSCPLPSYTHTHTHIKSLFTNDKDTARNKRQSCFKVSTSNSHRMCFMHPLRDIWHQLCCTKGDPKNKSNVNFRNTQEHELNNEGYQYKKF